MTEEERRESLRKSQRKYQEGLRTYILRFRREKDADVIERLDSQANLTGYVRELVRGDL